MALRLFCPALEIGRVRLLESEARHALKSRRLRPGDPLILFDGRGAYAHARLDDAGDSRHSASAGSGTARPKHAARLLVTVSAVERVPAPAAQLTLVVPGCKGPRLDWLVEKSTELGVTRLVLAEFERSVVHVSPHHAAGLERTSIEACKQCGRLWLPQISAGALLREAIQDGRHCDPAPTLLVYADPTAALPLAHWFQAQQRPGVRVAMVIGPEGGLSASETTLLQDAGAQPVRLAEHVLRVETAAIAAAAVWAAGLAWGGLP